MCCRYGPLFALHLGPHFTVVVNDHQHAKEVLQQKGRDFAGRPSMVGHEERERRSALTRDTTNIWSGPLQVTTDLLTRGGKDIAFSDYTPLWKLHRRLVHNSFTLFGERTGRLQDIGTEPR